jgi:hypothetical protein
MAITLGEAARLTGLGKTTARCAVEFANLSGPLVAQRELSDQCRVSQSAISRGEQVNGTPPMQIRNLSAIRRVIEEHGIEFLGLDGVRLLPGSSKN